jgi:hypothetical protein
LCPANNYSIYYLPAFKAGRFHTAFKRSKKRKLMSIQERIYLEDQNMGETRLHKETPAAARQMRFEQQGMYWRMDSLSSSRFLSHALCYLTTYGEPPTKDGNILYAEIAEDDLLLLNSLFENLILEDRVLQLLPAQPCEPLTLEGKNGITLHICHKVSGRNVMRSMILETKDHETGKKTS